MDPVFRTQGTQTLIYGNCIKQPPSWNIVLLVSYDMFAISKSKVASLFLDDIQNFFAEKEIYYSVNVQFTGISGFSHSYDFLLQRSRTKPERLCQAVNNPNKTTMGNILFAWNDTKPARKKKLLTMKLW